MMNKFAIKTSIFSIVRPLLTNYTYTAKRGISKGLKRKGGLGFISEKIIPIDLEESFLMTLDLDGKTVYDIGGFQGVFTIFFARAVGNYGRVITFEPNPINYDRILENVRLNNFDNVEVRNIGIGRAMEDLDLVFHPSTPGQGSFDEDFIKRNMKREGAKRIKVKIDSLDHLVKEYDLPKPQLIKIDVEGYELTVLEGMKETLAKYNPQLLIEIHGVDNHQSMDIGQKVLELLYSHGYSIYHMESKSMIVHSNIKEFKGGHIYCTV